MKISDLKKQALSIIKDATREQLEDGFYPIDDETLCVGISAECGDVTHKEKRYPNIEKWLAKEAEKRFSELPEPAPEVEEEDLNIDPSFDCCARSEDLAAYRKSFLRF